MKPDTKTLLTFVKTFLTVQWQNWLFQHVRLNPRKHSHVLKMCYVVRLLTVRQRTFLCMMFHSYVVLYFLFILSLLLLSTCTGEFI